MYYCSFYFLFSLSRSRSLSLCLSSLCLCPISKNEVIKFHWKAQTRLIFHNKYNNTGKNSWVLATISYDCKRLKVLHTQVFTHECTSVRSQTRPNELNFCWPSQKQTTERFNKCTKFRNAHWKVKYGSLCVHRVTDRDFFFPFWISKDGMRIKVIDKLIG